jgi:hypothetical protein
MKATFIELPPFERHRQEYLDDDAYKALQDELLKNPVAGDVIAGTGGLRKFRFADAQRGKGKRGGLRIIYYWRFSEDQFWLFTIFNKNDAADLTAAQRKVLATLLKNEINARNNHAETGYFR